MPFHCCALAVRQCLRRKGNGTPEIGESFMVCYLFSLMAHVGIGPQTPKDLQIDAYCLLVPFIIP
jgi:hypothetical protein